MIILRILSFLLCLSASHASAFSQEDINIQAIDTLMTSAASAHHFNGTLLIAKGEHILYEKTLGNYGSPTSNSQFVLASVSKQITSALILSLVDQNLLRLDQCIGDYIDNIPSDWISRGVTIKHLLNHTSGIMELNKPVAFEPGSRFEYSPAVGYYLLGRIAEKASGQIFPDLLKTFFHKAGMTHSGFALMQDIQMLYHHYSHLAHGFTEKDKVISEINSLESKVATDKEPYFHPGGGMIATSHDLLAWNIALHQKHLLSEAIYKQMISPSTIRNNPRYGPIGYGLGVQILEKHQMVEISHSGYIPGYMSTLLYYPRQEVSVIILENVSQPIDDSFSCFSVHDKIRKIIRISINPEIKD